MVLLTAKLCHMKMWSGCPLSPTTHSGAEPATAALSQLVRLYEKSQNQTFLIKWGTNTQWLLRLDDLSKTSTLTTQLFTWENFPRKDNLKNKLVRPSEVVSRNLSMKNHHHRPRGCAYNPKLARVGKYLSHCWSLSKENCLMEVYAMARSTEIGVKTHICGRVGFCLTKNGLAIVSRRFWQGFVFCKEFPNLVLFPGVHFTRGTSVLFCKDECGASPKRIHPRESQQKMVNCVEAL